MISGKQQDGEQIKLRPVVLLADVEQTITKKNQSQIVDAIIAFITKNRGQPPYLVDSKGRTHSVISLYRDARFVPKSRIDADPTMTGKARQQRQELGVVSSVNELALSGEVKLNGITGSVVEAFQAPDIGPHGKENLVDVVLKLKNGRGLNVSCKQTKAADLGGGGMAGLSKIAPHLIRKLYAKVQADLKKDGYVEGGTYATADMPTYVYKIPNVELEKIFHGHDDIGGTIDYFYIGPDKVSIEPNRQLNGKFISVREFAQAKDFYFRLRTRDIVNGKVTIDYKKKTKEGFPAIFTTGPAKSNAARFVIDDAPPISAKKRTL